MKIVEDLLKNLKLTKPIVFFDIESTGKSEKFDRIVELCLVKYFPKEKPQTINYLINPEMPISSEAYAIHGISDADVKDKPTFRKLAIEIFGHFSGSDIGGFNVLNFDLPMILREFERAEMRLPFDQNTRIIDAMRIFHKKERRDLSAAYKFYCKKEMENAHQAQADITATIEVFSKQLELYEMSDDVKTISDFCKYEDEINSLDFSGKFIRNEKGEPCFNFGKNKGELVKNNLGMLKWMLDKDFDPYTRQVAEKLLIELT